MSTDARSTLFGADRRVIALGFARMADAMGNSFLIVVLPLYIASNYITGSFFGMTESMITGIVIGLYGLVSSIFQPLTGIASDKAGKRRLFVLVGLVLFMFANFSYVIADNYWLLLIIRAVQGFSAALTITASVALVSEVSIPENRGQNMGIYNAFRLIGFGTGPLFSGILIESGPYQIPVVGEINGFIASFALAAFMALVSVILVTFLVSDPEETQPSRVKAAFRFTSESEERLLDPIFALGIATFIMSSGFALIASIEPEINRRLNQGAFMFAIQFSVMVGVLAIAQPIVGSLSDKSSRKIWILIGLTVLAPVTFLQGLSTESWHLIATRFMQGICGAMIFAPALALAGDLAKKGQSGSQLSVLTVSFGIGISFGSFLSGYAIRFGFLAPFAVGAILALLGVVLVRTQIPDR